MFFILHRPQLRDGDRGVWYWSQLKIGDRRWLPKDTTSFQWDDRSRLVVRSSWPLHVLRPSSVVGCRLLSTTQGRDRGSGVYTLLRLYGGVYTLLRVDLKGTSKFEVNECYLVNELWTGGGGAGLCVWITDEGTDTINPKRFPCSDWPISIYTSPQIIPLTWVC